MRIEDYLDTLDVELVVRRYANQDNRWCAYFAGCEVKEGSILGSAHGNGPSPDIAIADYIRQIRGKRIVLNAMDKKRRREYTVPTQLSVAIDRLSGDVSDHGPRSG